VNSRFVPGAAPAQAIIAADARAAIVTASYAPDFERCRLLCETVDRYVSNAAHHYLLVEDRDARLFSALESRTRTVVRESDLLPGWLRPYNDPLSLFRRRIWLSLRTQPLRGWHVQQLRRIAIAGHVREPVLVYCDSDVAFLKPFDCASFVRDGMVRLLRRDDALASGERQEHRIWSANAGRALGITAPEVSTHDYVATLIAWRRDTVEAMCRHIEQLHARHWVEVLGSARKFSECILYGRYADEVIGGAGHFHAREEFCRVHWTGEPLSDEDFRDFVATMAPEQVAIGMQSFIGTDLARIRRLLGS
jgi:hypothetical protein